MPGIPGDALDSRSTAQQCRDFIVELSALQSSFGNTFGVAPLLKAGTDFETAPNFFTGSISAFALSADLRQGVPFPRNSYSRWAAPGQGVHPTRNTGGTAINTSTAVGSQFALAFSEFSSDDPATPAFNFNGIVGGVVNFDPDFPSRLHVARVVGAVNSPEWFCDLSQFGMGTVDADGHVHFRADSFNSVPCGLFGALPGNNYFRTDLLARTCGTLNVVSDQGASNASDWLLVSSTVIHNVPNIIPGSITGGSPLVIGSNFISQFVHGALATLSTTSAHLSGTTDHRGAVAYGIHSFPAIFGTGAVNGTGAILSRTGTTNNRISLFGLGVNGGPVGAISRELPALVTDPETGYSAGGTWTHIFGATAFRGGSSQVGLGRDQAGRLLAAAVFNVGGTSSGEATNTIAVARVTPTTTDWSVAAYTNGANGKPIRDGAGNDIGNLVELATGPSLSPPMIDSVGNVWFLSPYALDAGGSGVGLFRAVYDPATFSYGLELVLSNGQVFRGANSDRDYLVRFITLNGATGISPGAPFSHAIRQGAHNGLDPATLATSDARTLGGLALNVNIVYDVDDNGVFEDIDAVPGTADQEYNVLLYVGAAVDCNGNGVPDDLDILLGNSQDFNGDGVPDECGVAISYCAGDGTGTTPCPCGNTGGPGRGCANSTASGGGLLAATGSASVSAGDLVLVGSGSQPGQPGLYFQGNNAINGGNGIQNGDGLRCAGGSIRRIQVVAAGGLASPNPGGSQTTVNIAAQGFANPGDTRRYQWWYRNPSPQAPCGTGFNLSNGLEVIWQP